jgi:hypothetical protein
VSVPVAGVGIPTGVVVAMSHDCAVLDEKPQSPSGVGLVPLLDELSTLLAMKGKKRDAPPDGEADS